MEEDETCTYPSCSGCPRTVAHSSAASVASVACGIAEGARPAGTWTHGGDDTCWPRRQHFHSSTDTGQHGEW